MWDTHVCHTIVMRDTRCEVPVMGPSVHSHACAHVRAHMRAHVSARTQVCTERAFPRASARASARVLARARARGDLKIERMAIERNWDWEIGSIADLESAHARARARVRIWRPGDLAI